MAADLYTLRTDDHFLAAVALARFSLSISSRSEVEHLERTAPISDSLLRSMAASAAPSRSLTRREKNKSHLSVRAHLSDDVTAVLPPT